ncbi:LamB/YcsF family protein [Helicobacter ailurogastricus]|uniref:LamB/YcsF family protein n=1 Tax=Helicobacter ailurogastricus TaxID=1578720 RepID=UPI00244D815A|nr:5-oxoprolinase subunit PxpA [Helicobacter ailurogastricus]GMB91046.1 LamB/YcsF family protein [Helicobacter ailurogastricus]
MEIVDLNSDMGEGFGVYRLGDDVAIMECVSSVNVACGWHAGDPLIMQERVALAKDLAIGLGAHPGYPDLLGFGRRDLKLSPKEARAYTLYQVGALYGFARAQQIPLEHVKLHGSFYNQVAYDLTLSQAVLEGLRDFDPHLIVLAPSLSPMAKLGQEMGLRVAQEVFADRHYLDDGRLVPRSHPRAFVTDVQEALARVVRMVKDRRVQTISGQEIEICADTICVHGDNPKAVQLAMHIKETLLKNGVKIQPLRAFLKGGVH